MTELTGVGARLREAREAQGLAVDDVAQSLKFAPRQIESLENERFDRLPGPTIARGMVRNYARLLKLDPEPLVERMAPQVEKAAPDPARISERYRPGTEFTDGAKRSTLLYAGFSIGLLVLVGAVAYEWQQQSAAPQFVAPVQERPVEEQAPAQVAAAAQVPAPVVIEPPAPVAEEPKPKPEAMAAAAPTAATTTTAAKAAAVSAERPLPPGMHRLVLRCEQESWMEVKDGTGRTLVSWLAPAGSERVVRGPGPFEVVIGNAAAVTLTFDGKPVDLRPHTRVSVARLTLK